MFECGDCNFCGAFGEFDEGGAELIVVGFVLKWSNDVRGRVEGRVMFVA